MKQKFSHWILFAALCLIAFAAAGEEYSKKFNQSWPAAGIETLSISNKFGEVRVNNDGGPNITIDVVVTAEGSESKARRILDDITVSFRKDGNTAYAETKIEDGFRSGNFTINYTVNMPSEKNLKLSNKYGNAVISKLTGNGDFVIAYGNITANSLEGPSTKLNLSYGKADIQTLAKAEVLVAYSKMVLGNGTTLKMDTKYSGFTMEKLESLWLESKYDNFTIGEIDGMEGNSKYTSYKINRLNKKLKLVSGYGTIKVDQIPADFDLLEVRSSYAQVSLGIEEGAGYQVDASCSYCEIAYPKEKFKGNRMVENTSQRLDGKVGAGSPGRVFVESRYGNIKLIK